MRDPLLKGMKNRLLQVVALYAPGAQSLRPQLHRMRGVKVGSGVFIGTDAIIETSRPHLVSIGDGAAIGIRSTVIAHFRGSTRADRGDVEAISVRIEEDAFIGPGVIILPNVTIGRGAVVNAGSVVTRSVPPLTMVQGNPATPVARCGVALGMKTPLKEFYRQLTPIKRKAPASEE
ncbi:MAG: acyltransferase [Actinobacteria bacterium]|nr:acyltransferase [Actinomycetota bacterium]